jgi:hypothetical protein
MILAPALIWMARDGSFCKVNNEDVLTTHTVAQKFMDFPIREAFHDTLGNMSFNPSRGYVESNVSHEYQSRKIMRNWSKWAFQQSLITVAVVESRNGTLLTALKRQYNDHRELAILAALKVSNASRYDQQTARVSGLPVDLWNDLIKAEGGRLFDNTHISKGPLTNMFPTSADHVNGSWGIRATCEGWEVFKENANDDENGLLKIARGSQINWPRKTESTEYRFQKKTIYGMIQKES